MFRKQHLSKHNRIATTLAGVLALILVAVAVVATRHHFKGFEVVDTEAEPDRVVPPAEHTPGHARMLELLRDIAKRSPDESLYLGSKIARDLRSQLAKLDEHASPIARWSLHNNLGYEELKLGNVRAAIEHHERAYALLPKVNVGAAEANRTRLLLAIDYLRLGEVENCIALYGPDSCLLPLRGGGLHTNVEGSTQAIRYFREVMRHAPRGHADYLTAHWLLSIAHMTLGRTQDELPENERLRPRAFESDIDFPRFYNESVWMGLATVNLSGGAVIDDFDGDGYLDIVTSTFDPNGPMTYAHNNGNGTFEDRTSEAGLDGLLGGLNLEHADYDNDGDLDILVMRGAWLGEFGKQPVSLLRNNGKGHFVDVTFESGLGKHMSPTQAAGWADYDNDGDLDLYIGNETTGAVMAPCELFRNNGDGTFTDVALTAGVGNQRWVKGVTWGDYDGDRFPDLFVSTYDGANRLYHNERDGTFVDVAVEVGLDKPTSSFPCWFWDYDNDGALDLFVSAYTGRPEHIGAHFLGLEPRYEPSGLFKGDGKGGFTNVTKEAKLIYPMLTMGSNFGDLNGDGYLDFYLGTGSPTYAALMPNVMFVNQGGKHFANVTTAGGFGHLQKGHGVAFADLDNDGDMDVFEQMGGAFPGDEFADALYVNPGFENRWITVKLVGVTSNRCAIGARIRVVVEEDGKQRSIYRHVNSGGSFGANPLRQTIGLGQAAQIVSFEIFWPTTGKTQTVEGVSLDANIRITEGRKGFEAVDAPAVKLKGDPGR